MSAKNLQFFKRIPSKHVLRASAVKMEATRLRRHFDEVLQAMGVAYAGEHFLPSFHMAQRSIACPGIDD